MPTSITIINILDKRAREQSDCIAYRYLQDGKQIELTYGELRNESLAIANKLLAKNLQGERVLLIYPHGLEFIKAFFGCLYAGVITVPVYPPRNNSRLFRLETIVKDADARGILTIVSLEEKIKKYSNFNNLELIFSDRITLLKVKDRNFKPDNEIAFLQYTSGSTGNPKGVIITHKNIIKNSQLIYKSFNHSDNSSVVSWLPMYHDMGLIGGILQPLYGGFPVTLFSPTDFLRKPFLWLKAISKFKATTSGAPNFAYQLCVDKIKEEDKNNLDLSNWNLAFTGAEPIRKETLENFSNAFGECGFRKSAFYPCYGMAESTLMISGGIKGELPVVVEKEEREIVSCGKIIDESSILIIDRQSNKICLEKEEGEIWVSKNDSIAGGYWNNLELTKKVFEAKIENSDREYLRTGDLGFIFQGGLFVTGRVKDLIIIRGQNYYPQDIERVVESSHVALKANSGAAFSIDIAGKEKLVIVQEVERSFIKKTGISRNDKEEDRSLSLDKNGRREGEINELKEEIKDSIRSAISREYGLNVCDIQLIKTESISRTSSGKIQRYLCKENYLNHLKLNSSPISIHNITESSDFKNNNLDKKNELQKREKNKKVSSIVNWLRKYAKDNINSQIIDERRCIPPHIVLDFGNKGLLGMQVPKEYGGLGLNNYETMQLLEQLGAIDTTLCLFVGLNNILGIRPILNYGSEELKEKLLSSLATGRELAAFALTEKVAGSNPQAIISQAIANSKNSWNINGEKIWSGSAAWASITNVFVREIDINGNYKGISAFAVPRGVPGLRQGKEALTMGMRGMVQNKVYFDNVPVTSQLLLGKSGKGMEVAQDAMMYGRLAIAFSCLGGMKRCAQLILRYASRRQVSTGRLLDNPVVLNRLGGLTAQITTVECLVTQIAKLLDTNITIPVELYAVCKTSAPEFFYKAADDLVQFLGGRGYIENNIAPQILRDARVLRIFEGPTETLEMFLGSRIINKIEFLEKQNDLDKNRKDNCFRFIRDIFKSPDIEDRLIKAIEKIKISFQNNTIFNKDIDRQRWIYILVGKITTYGILLAATKYTYKQNPTKDLSRAVSWTELKLDREIEKALTINPNELVTETADITSSLINSYQETIGDIQQNLPGEDREIDSLLVKEVQKNTRDIDRELKEIKNIVPDINSESVRDCLSQWLSNKLQIPLTKIDPNKSFADYGIDSVMAVELAQDLEEWLPNSLEVEPTLVWNFPNITLLASYLAEQQNTKEKKEELPLSNEDKDIENLSKDELSKSLLEEIALAKGIYN